MNKKEFISFLDEKLYYLLDNAKNTEISKYESVIDNYVNMGQSEEDAVASFGDPNDLVKAIYLSHGLDYKKFNSSSITGKGIKDSFKSFYSSITGTDKKKAKNAILGFLYIILVVILLKVVFIFIRDMGTQVFSDLYSDTTFSRIYDITFEVLYVLVAIFVFFKMFTKRFK